MRSCGEQARVSGQPAQPAVPADRCAPEIVRFLTVSAALAAAELDDAEGITVGYMSQNFGYEGKAAALKRAVAAVRQASIEGHAPLMRGRHVDTSS